MFWTLESNGHERNEDINVVSNPKRMLRDRRCTAASSSNKNPVGNPPIIRQSLEAELQKPAAPIPAAEAKRMCDGLANKPVSKERRASIIPPTLSRSSGRPEDTVCEQIASIPALVKDTAVRLSDYVRRVTEPSPDTNVILVI